MPQEIDFFSFLHDSEIAKDQNEEEEEENFQGKYYYDIDNGFWFLIKSDIPFEKI